MPGALDGIRVLDLTWVLSGPYASMILADLGADVVKVERPPHGDVARTTGPFVANESIYFQSINRGKRSISLDLRTDAGKELFLQLVEQADIVMENFTAGTMDRLGLGEEALRARNPRIIYSATSGFGQDGPLKDKPALDIVIQGMGGVMSITGYPGGPPARPGFSMGDITAGLYTAIGVLAALHERERSGQGQMLDLSMLDCQIAVLENAVARFFATGQEPQPLGTRHPSATPFQAFPSADGWLVLALAWGVENQWELYCAAIDRVALINDQRFDTSFKRTQNHAELEPILFDAMRQKTTGEWIDILGPYGMPIGPLNTISQAVSQEQIQLRHMVAEVEHPTAGTLKLSNSPLKLSRTPATAGGPAPAFAADTQAVLSAWLDLDTAAVAALADLGAIVPEGGPDIAAYLES
ncbi:MAG: CoA:oxalate CoA-transferase [Chloroflexi bacterium]|nr:MAG: CoA:oxalate CoA-transferase [Chloroflexota bacterium]